MHDSPPSERTPPGFAGLAGLEEMAQRVADAVAASTADETEICWIESASDAAAAGDAPAPAAGRGRTVFVRAREGARRGSFRTGATEPSDLAAAVRQAVAASRGAEPAERVPFEDDGEASLAGPPPAEPPRLRDPEVATLGPLAAAEVLAAAGGRGTLVWSLCRVVVATSEGVSRSAEATAVTLEVESDGARAAASARFLAELDPRAIAERARRRSPSGAPAEEPGEAAAGPVLFSQEATADLVAALAATGLSSAGFAAAGSPLAGMLGEHVFAPAVDLVDDGLDPAGLPFPFDLLGRARRRLALIEAGVPRTPAIDEVLSRRLRRPPTPHAVGPGEARPEHLFLLPRDDEAAVMAAAEGGVWVGALDRLACFDPGRLAVRARALGARRIAGGRLAGVLPPLVWEDSLLRLFARVRALGGPPVRRALGREGLGGVSAPLLAVDGAEALRLLAP